MPIIPEYLDLLIVEYITRAFWIKRALLLEISYVLSVQVFKASVEGFMCVRVGYTLISPLISFGRRVSRRLLNNLICGLFISTLLIIRDAI